LIPPVVHESFDLLHAYDLSGTRSVGLERRPPHNRFEGDELNRYRFFHVDHSLVPVDLAARSLDRVYNECVVALDVVAAVIYGLRRGTLHLWKLRKVCSSAQLP
jgi:hypothetical protein